MDKNTFGRSLVSRPNYLRLQKALNDDLSARNDLIQPRIFVGSNKFVALCRKVFRKG